VDSIPLCDKFFISIDTDGELRRAAQTTIYIILDAMTRMISPILAFTSDERLLS